MSTKPLEKISKLFTSIIYRVTMLVMGTAIIFIESDKFHWSVYLISLTAYALIGFIYRVFKPENSVIRLISDYVFITIILYGKNLDVFINAGFIMIPIVNSVNHTSQVKASASIWRLYAACLLSMIIITHFQIKVSWIIVFSAFGIISFLTKIKEWITRMDNTALASINDYHGENVRLGNSHLLLQKIIHNWQSNRLLTGLCGKPVNIVVFKIGVDRFRLISGASFVKNYVFLDENSVFQELKLGGVMYNAGVLIDSQTQKPNVCIGLKGQHNDYLFYLEFEKPIDSRRVFDSYMISIFSKGLFFVVKVLDNEGTIINDRNSLLRKIQNRISLMDRTISVVHFINNRLSPIINYFQMIKFYNEQLHNPESQAYIIELKQLIESEQRKATESLNQIDTRSKTLLNRVAEMRLESSSIRVKLKQLVRFVRDAWSEHNFTDSGMLVDWREDTLEKGLILDANELWLVLEEIATNSTKYGRGKSFIHFFEIDGVPIITFSNSIAANSNVVLSKRTKILVEQFNSNELNEIMRRNNYGLYMMKNYFNKYSIKSAIILNTNSFTLTIRLSHAS